MAQKNLIKAYGGPIVEHAGTGLKMQEAVARIADSLAKSLPKECHFRRTAKAATDFELDANSRTDVSTITTDAVDRQGDVVLPDGGDFKFYNKVVAWCHQYDILPLGVSLWIKPTKDNHGLIAKTQYAKKPADWHDQWLPDGVLSCMQMDPPVCTGKSIGFIPLNFRKATASELEARPELADAWGIIDKWAMLEYSVCLIPCNPQAELIAVSKMLRQVDPKLATRATLDIRRAMKGFVTPDTIEKYRKRRIGEFKAELTKQVGRKVTERIHRLLGTP